jgi:hypothetical protein
MHECIHASIDPALRGWTSAVGTGMFRVDRSIQLCYQKKMRAGRPTKRTQIARILFQDPRALDVSFVR